jgi:hypothetical protein
VRTIRTVPAPPAHAPTVVPPDANKYNGPQPALTLRERANVKAALAAGASPRALAVRYNVSTRTIYRWARRDPDPLVTLVAGALSTHLPDQDPDRLDRAARDAVARIRRDAVR